MSRQKLVGVAAILTSASILLRIVEHCVKGFRTESVRLLPATFRTTRDGERVANPAEYHVVIVDADGERAEIPQITEPDLRKALKIHLSKKPARRLLAAYDLQEEEKKRDALKSALAECESNLKRLREEAAALKKADPQFNPEESAKVLRRILSTEGTVSFKRRPRKARKS